MNRVTPTLEHKNKHPAKKKRNESYSVLYMQGLSEQIKRLLRCYNIRSAFRSGISLAKILSKIQFTERQKLTLSRLVEALTHR